MCEIKPTKGIELLEGKHDELITIGVSSAGFDGDNLAIIVVNGVWLYCERNENNHYRGLHVAVINSRNGRIKSS